MPSKVAPGIAATTALLILVLTVIAMSMINAKERYADGPRELTDRAVAILAAKNAVSNVPGKLFFKDAKRDTNHNEVNNSDSYYLEKIIDANNQSSLRLTINDDADESLQIWGNSCAATQNCGGPGVKTHHFRADGATAHKGSLILGPNVAPGDWGTNHGIHIHNKLAGDWTHFPWTNGVNYIRGSTRVEKGDLHLDGNMFHNGATMETAAWHNIHSPGRQHISSEELLYLLPKNGTVVGKESGGNGHLSVQGQLMSVGDGLHILNRNDGRWSHFPWSDGVNYIRGRTRVDGDLSVRDNVDINGKLCVGGTCVTASELRAIKNNAARRN